MSTLAPQEYFGKTLAFRVRKNVLLAVHATVPSDEDWQIVVGAVSSLQASQAMAHVVAVALANDAIPATQQRTQVASQVDYDRVRIALVGGGRAMRMAIKAFSLFYPWTRGFSLDALDSALTFVSVPDLGQAHRDLSELMQHFGNRTALEV